MFEEVNTFLEQFMSGPLPAGLAAGEQDGCVGSDYESRMMEEAPQAFDYRMEDICFSIAESTFVGSLQQNWDCPQLSLNELFIM